MKKNLIIIFMLLATWLTAAAQDFQVGGISYTKISDQAVSVVKGAKAYEGDIVVPEQITVDGISYAVEAIGKQAFANSQLSSCKLPESIREIGEEAFLRSTITNIELPEGLQALENGVFAITPITSITIPSTLMELREITDGCPFAYMGYVKSDGRYYGLDHISVAEGNAVYDSRNQCDAMIETATNTIVQATNNTVIPADVTAIGQRAFSGLCHLKTLVLSANIETLGYYCFAGCDSLADIYCYGTTPPQGGTEGALAFGRYGDFNFDGATLHVPFGSKEAYQNTAPWNRFPNIVEFYIDGISLPTASDESVERYTVDGRPAAGSTKGLLIIRRGNVSKKMVAK